MVSTLFIWSLLAVIQRVFGADTACNGDVSLCSKLYSNVTFVGTHNSASVGTRMSDNQHFGVSTQLRDGVRLLQGQGHNNSENTASGINICHSACALQDGGTLEDYLKNVKSWVDANPREVITILWVNSDGLPVTQWAKAYESSGLAAKSYAPGVDKVAAWPTLGALIESGTTVINFITSKADHAAVPYILHQWSNIWETPYENHDYTNFTCGLDRGTRPNLLYMANHFVYTTMTFLGATIDSPDTGNIDKTNAESSVLAHGNLCGSLNSRYPNFFLVDYYEKGSGGVLRAAAAMNNVAYIERTLGTGAASAISTFFGGQYEIRNIAIVVAVGVAVLILSWIAICCFCKRRSRRRRHSDSQAESLIAPVKMSSFAPAPEAPKTFQNRLSQQARYAPVYHEPESLVPLRPGMNGDRTRAGSQSSWNSSNTAFSELRGGGRPPPTKLSQPSVYTQYDPYRSQYQGHDHRTDWQNRR